MSNSASLLNRRIVVISGGTGGSAVLRGLKAYPVNLTAVCSVFDSGGSTGRLRDELGVLPPGDLRQCILALSQDENWRDLFNHRFEDGKGSSLDDHTVGNILLSACEELHGRIEGIRHMSRILDVQGEVLPVSINDAHLEATLSDGAVIRGEKEIDTRSHEDNRTITRVSLNPAAFISREASDAIVNADIIVIAPGDLYTSIIPNLLVDGVSEAMGDSNARVVYVVNLMTKYAETRGYDVADFVNTLLRYNIGRDQLDAVLINEGQIPPNLLQHYLEKERAEPVRFDDAVMQKMAGRCRNVVCADLVSQRGLKENLVRHDPNALGRLIMQISRENA